MRQDTFDAIAHRTISALNLEVQEYRHRATGARHVHLAANDAHNVFLVAFLTVPQDSTGVAHILEHTALCGSRRYPVRDPFFMMMRRSLSTFMNAFTSSDWTAYPFASQNRKDFDNLLEVYLDATFFPLLNELDFAQEGHRVEFANTDDSDRELIYKGVVFNEMKGAMSSPVTCLSQILQSLLFPTTTYHYNSGGDPAHIPDLTHAQLRAFHARHYHPSNAIFMTFGNIPAAEHQARFEDRVLQHFQRQTLDFRVPDERRYQEPLTATESYAIDPAEETTEKTHTVLGWLLDPVVDPLSVMRARLLSDALLDNSSSPLRRALETSNLGTAPSPLCGFDTSTREATFVCGLEGSEPDRAQAVEDLVLGVLREVASNGLPRETLESVLHQLELSQREISGDGYPYGLHLLLEALTPAIHGADPGTALDLDPMLDQLRKDIADPDFIRTLARRMLLENPHRVRLMMAPDPDLDVKRTRSEQQRLATMKSGMSAEDRQRILRQSEALAARQSQHDDPELLPRVGLDDVPADLRIPESRADVIGTLPTTWFARSTNGMLYEQLALEMPALDEDLFDLLPLFCACLTEVGSGGRDYLSTQALQAAVTGGLSARCIVRADVDEPQQTRAALVIAGKALARNHSALGNLLVETVSSARFDELDRLRELVAQLRVEREESVVDHGHLFAMIAASAGLSPTAATLHRWDGLRGLQRLKALDDALDEADALEDLGRQLGRLRDLLDSTPRQLLVVSEAELQERVTAAFTGQGHTKTPTGAAPHRFQASDGTAARQGWAANTQVNFCAMAFPTVAINHSNAPALTILGEFLRNGYLHREIRERGGAYGAGAGYHGDTGTFRFFSYRDPQLQSTLKAFEHSIRWLLETAHPPRALEEAILGVIAAIDRPGSPAGEAIATFLGTLFGRTPNQRRTFRQRLLGVTLDDLRRVTETYLSPSRASVCVVSDAATLKLQETLEIHRI